MAPKKQPAKKAKRKARLFRLYMAEASEGYVSEWCEWEAKYGHPPKGSILTREVLPRTRTRKEER